MLYLNRYCDVVDFMTDNNEESLNILMVDDEADVEILIKQKFKQEIKSKKYTFEFAYNGVQALRLLEANPTIRIVLSDINMPEMDGLILLEKISKQFPDVVVIMISAYSDMDNIRKAMNYGAYDFLTKPLNFTDLTNTIHKAQRYVLQMQTALTNKTQLNKILDELHVAKSIQQSILPKGYVQSGHCELYGVMEPAREIGGDFFDYFSVDDSHLGFAVGDVSGKGVPAALFMSVTRTLLRANGYGQLSPAACVNRMNDALFRENSELMFVTLFYGVIHIQTGKLKYVCAGHEKPVLIHSDGTIDELNDAGYIVLGIKQDVEYIDAECILQNGDILMIYSDGLTDAINVESQEYGLERAIDVIVSHPRNHLNEMIEKLFQQIKQYCGAAPQFDDTTLLFLRFDQQHLAGYSQKFSYPLFKSSVKSTIAHLEKATQDVESFMKTHDINQKMSHVLNLIYNEMLFIIITKLSDDGQFHRIETELKLSGSDIELTLIYDGGSFNPFESFGELGKTVEHSVEDVKYLGIFLTKSFSKIINYENIDGKNILRAIIEIP